MSDARHIVEASCPDEEILIAHLVGSLADTDAVRVDDHCCACDACAAMLLTGASRLRIATPLAPVPDVVQRKALAGGVVPHVSVPAVRPAARPSVGAWREQFLRLPVLMPVSFVAGVLLMIGLHHGVRQSSQSLLRSVPEAGVIVAVPEAAVYALPEVHAPVLTTLPQGTAVAIVAEQRGWYRIALPEHSTGWVQQNGVQLR